MAGLHPIVERDIERQQSWDRSMCPCYRDKRGNWQLCQYHDGMETALDPGVLAEAGYRLVRACPRCDGSGFAPYRGEREECPACCGRGVLLDEMEDE